MQHKIIQQIPGDHSLVAVELKSGGWSLYEPGCQTRKILPVRFDNAVDALATIYCAQPENLKNNRDLWIRHALACGARPAAE